MTVDIQLPVTKNLGLDPEFFIVDENGEAISSHLLDRHFVSKGTGYAVEWNVHRDGPAFEIGMSPHTCRDYLVPTMQLLMAEMHNRAEKLGYKLSLDATVELTAASMKNAPPDVSEFGCQPDINAYTLQDKAAEMPSKRFRKRFTGGHIHMQTTTKERMDLAALAVAADYLIALPAVVLLGEAHKEKEAERRQYYGQAGSFRVQPHGFEYRTLSATGFMYHPVLTYAWFEIIRSLKLKPEDLRAVAKELKMGEVRNAINTHDVAAARDIYMDDKLFDRIIDRVARRSGTRRELIKALIKADADGKKWNTSPQVNWAWDTFFKVYGTANHAYWGDQSAMSGALDESILPQREHVLTELGWTKERMKLVRATKKYPVVADAQKKIEPDEDETWFEDDEDDSDWSE